MIFFYELIFVQNVDEEGLQPEVTNDQYNFISTEITTAASGKDTEAPKFSF